ncbi:hypothetical protein ILUMI_07226 [Ignelater luminosus]|uniref:Uncharacterized protein n=1 Tax=Ignelater luminosus TaxID=2038154 RepID=A0A8K0GBU0_IGNLU|nr:hypothetical protein ILUMI_07226 [Ignelater luminosus]
MATRQMSPTGRNPSPRVATLHGQLGGHAEWTQRHRQLAEDCGRRERLPSPQRKPNGGGWHKVTPGPGAGEEQPRLHRRCHHIL